MAPQDAACLEKLADMLPQHESEGWFEDEASILELAVEMDDDDDLWDTTLTRLPTFIAQDASGLRNEHLTWMARTDQQLPLRRFLMAHANQVCPEDQRVFMWRAVHHQTAGALQKARGRAPAST